MMSLAGEPAPGHTGLLLRHLALATATASGAVGAMLAAGLDWSAALPAGFAVFSVSLLIFLAARQMAAIAPAPVSLPPASNDTMACDGLLDRLAGLITRHDSAGHLISAHGAKRLEYGLGSRSGDTAFLDAIHISGRLAYLQAIDDLRQGAVLAEVEFLMILPGAEAVFRPVRSVMTAEFSETGEFAGFIAQTLDIDQEWALRDEIDSWKSEALTANDAKTRFLAAVSHELRTPLNAILGFSDILIGEYFGTFQNARQKEYVELINQSGHHLLAVVNTMLDMSKIEAGRYELIKEPFSIAAAIHTVDEMLGLQAKTKNVALATRVARGLDEVIGDRRAIQQVLINLANNAIKFTEPGGVVTIDAACDCRDLILTVSDTGIGIPKDKMAMIGKPFMQVQNDYTRQYEGSGLGLALVKGLIGLHGGAFRIESEEGEGTVITVTVPLDGEGHAGAETFEFPPRLHEDAGKEKTGEHRHGIAKAKTA